MPDPPFPDYLAALVGRLEAVAGDAAGRRVAAGSAALGDFDPARSDVDVQAVATKRLVARRARSGSPSALSHAALPCPVRGLEFVLYAREDLPTARPAFQLNLNTGPRMERHAGLRPGAEPRFWFVLDVAIARERAHPLAGPPAATCCPSSPRAARARRAARRARLVRRAGGDEPRPCSPRAARGRGRPTAVAVQGRGGRVGARRLADPAPVDRALAHRDDPAVAPPTADERDALVSLALAAA